MDVVIKILAQFFYGGSDAEIDIGKHSTVELAARYGRKDNIAMLN